MTVHFVKKVVKTENVKNFGLCRHWVHGKCLSLFNKHKFQTFIEYYKNEEWFCYESSKDIFPFIHLHEEDCQIAILEANYPILYSDKLKLICYQLKSTDIFNKNLFIRK